MAYENAAIHDVHSDHLGTPKLLTNAAGGVVWRSAHEAFGKAALEAGNSVTFNIRFPGQYFDAESGLHDNRFRTYDPAVGRYLSADPLGQRARPNLYEYSLNNPQNFFDPFGLYGTNSCGYYDQACSASGGTYECSVAPELCPAFPDDDTSLESPDPVGVTLGARCRQRARPFRSAMGFGMLCAWGLSRSS
jgi:RHS repeat-associated protein